MKKEHGFSFKKNLNKSKTTTKSPLPAKQLKQQYQSQAFEREGGAKSSSNDMGSLQREEWESGGRMKEGIAHTLLLILRWSCQGQALATQEIRSKEVFKI